MSRHRVLSSILVLSLVLTLAFFPRSPLRAQGNPIVFAVTTANTLISFNAWSPGTLLSSIPIKGLSAGEVILGIDFRPVNGKLTAISNANRLYVLDVTTGAASAIGNGSLNPGLSGGAFGFDFNPTVDRIRLVSDAGQDLRLNPINGAVAAVDGTITYASTDANANATPQVVASAYTNNFGGAGSTVLYNIDAAQDVLVTQNPPNSGTLNTVGALGVDAGDLTSFDIMSDRTGTDNAFASINSTLYSINLVTGGATAIGGIASPEAVIAISITASVAAMMTVPLCGDFDGSTTPIVRASVPGMNIYCRVLAKNGTLINAAAASQIGNADIIAQGVIQAVDIFVPNGTTTFPNAAQVCLQGKGRFIYLDATQAPRTPQLLASKDQQGYTCAFIPNTGTVVLVKS
ncbi:MAG: DUF4394 domain-containing protein [Anaerolineae bacterium]|nr:DUF4394 domain-containing protein [Anaerolineae bacterium]